MDLMHAYTHLHRLHLLLLGLYEDKSLTRRAVFSVFTPPSLPPFLAVRNLGSPLFSATEELPHFLFDARLSPPARVVSVIHSNLAHPSTCRASLSFIVENNGEETLQGFTPDYFPTSRVLID